MTTLASLVAILLRFTRITKSAEEPGCCDEGWKWYCVSTVRGHPRMGTIGDGAEGSVLACSCASSSQAAQDG